MREAYAALLRKERDSMAIEDYYYPLMVSSTAQAVDEYGSAVTSYGEPREVLGYIGKPSSRQEIVAAQRGVSIDGRLYAPADAGIQAFDVIQDTASGYRFQVVSDPRDVARRGHHIEADLMRMRGGADIAYSE